MSISVATVLGFASIGLAAWGRLWDSLGVAVNDRAALSTALAIVVLVSGFLFGLYFQQNDIKDEIVESQLQQLTVSLSGAEKIISSLLLDSQRKVESLLQEQRKEIADFHRMIPADRLYACYSGDDAMLKLMEILQEGKARVMLNTRILSPDISKWSFAIDSPWDIAVRQAVDSGLTFREVVSPADRELAQGRLEASKGKRGHYNAWILDHKLPSFLNFSIVHYKDGRKEVLFGWVVSVTHGYEGTVIRSTDSRIVITFERWHEELLGAGVLVA